MAEKYAPDFEVITALKEYLANDQNRFVFQLYFRSLALLDEPKIPRALIAIEMLESAFSAFEAGFKHADLLNAYPVGSWREDTVEVPRAWLRILVNGWAKYKSSPKGTTLGEALNLEGIKEGGDPARHELRRLNERHQLSNAVLVEYLLERASGGRGSWERACAIVADATGKSERTVRRASEASRGRTLRSLARFGAIKANTARSGGR